MIYDLAMNDQDLNNIRGVIKEEITASEGRVMAEVGKFVEDVILPAIEDKADKKDIARLESRMGNVETRLDNLDRKLDHFSAQAIKHEQEIKNIMSTPTIAHELNRKKTN